MRQREDMVIRGTKSGMSTSKGSLSVSCAGASQKSLTIEFQSQSVGEMMRVITRASAPRIITRKRDAKDEEEFSDKRTTKLMLIINDMGGQGGRGSKIASALRFVTGCSP